MATKNFSDFLLGRIEELGGQAIHALTPSILLYDDMEEIRVHYQFFLVVGILASIAVLVIYIVDRFIIHQQEKEIRKIVGRLRLSSKHNSGEVQETALETLEQRQAQWIDEQIKAKEQVKGNKTQTRKFTVGKPVSPGLADIDPEHLPTFFR